MQNQRNGSSQKSMAKHGGGPRRGVRSYLRRLSQSYVPTPDSGPAQMWDAGSVTVGGEGYDFSVRAHR